MKHTSTYHRLRIHNLHIAYTQSNGVMKNILSGIDADVNSPGITCLMGSNGSGKSSLLRNIAGIEKPLQGTIAIDEKNILSYTKHQLSSVVSIVFTDTPIDTEISVYALIALGRYPYSGWLGRLRDEDLTAVNTAIKLTGIEHLAQQSFISLSDGEKQICMIARALAQETPFILLDEPTSFLDIPNKIKVMNLLKSVARNQNKYIIMATHDLDLALEMADKLWLIAGNNTLYSGVPEDLALQNRFDEVFDKAQLQFNKLTAKFQIPSTPGNKQIRVLANDEALSFWTHKALQKAGYQIVSSKENNTTSPIPLIECISTKSWILHFENNNTEYNNLESILYALSHVKM